MYAPLQHKPNAIQPKLEIGQPGDEYEQEADTVADKVMRMPETATSDEEEGVLQPKLQPGPYSKLQMVPLPSTQMVQRKCAECEEEKVQMAPDIQRQIDDELDLLGESILKIPAGERIVRFTVTNLTTGAILQDYQNISGFNQQTRQYYYFDENSPSGRYKLHAQTNNTDYNFIHFHMGLSSSAGFEVNVKTLKSKLFSSDAQLKDTLNGGAVIGYGASGTYVQKIQTALGVLVSSIEITSSELSESYYGPSTKKAVVEFQKKHGLVDKYGNYDGIVGPVTLEKLDDEWAYNPIPKVTYSDDQNVVIGDGLGGILIGPGGKTIYTDSHIPKQTTKSENKVEEDKPEEQLSRFAGLKGLELLSEIVKVADETKIEDDPIEWDTIDVLAYMIFDNHAQLVKDLWLHDYRNMIKVAAKEFDIPVLLLAGVAYTEVGGDPLWIDDIAYDVRSFDHLADPLLEPLTITNPPDQTSFGYVSIQVRRALESLELEDTWVNEQSVISGLKDPKTNILIVAKHLSDLRDIDFPGKTADEYTDDDIIITGARYYHGPNVSLEYLKEHSGYGDRIIEKKSKLNTLMLDY